MSKRQYDLLIAEKGSNKSLITLRILTKMLFSTHKMITAWEENETINQSNFSEWINLFSKLNWFKTE
jgi:hypothetical protein